MKEVMCWKCGKPINDIRQSDGSLYVSSPPKYAHFKCPGGNHKTPWGLILWELLMVSWFLLFCILVAYLAPPK